MSSSSETSNQRALEQAVDHWNRGHLPDYLRLYGTDVILHGYAGIEPGIASVRTYYEGWWQAFPGSQIMLKDVLSSGDRVACRLVLEGIHAGLFRGLAASGRPVSVSGFTILRFVDGQCVERWSLVDSLTLLTQIGALGATRQ
jgi:predicted ester cyclase